MRYLTQSESYNFLKNFPETEGVKLDDKDYSLASLYSIINKKTTKNIKVDEKFTFGFAK
jgi:hypothetical protein